MINTEMKDAIEYDIRKAVNDYMTANGISKREAIYKAHEIIKKLADECKRDENPCFDCGFWDNISEGCCVVSSDKWYACPIESKKLENIQALKEYAERGV